MGSTNYNFIGTNPDNPTYAQQLINAMHDAGSNPNTRVGIRHFLNMAMFTPNVDITKREDLEKFFSTQSFMKCLIKKGYTKNTINRYCSDVRKFLTMIRLNSSVSKTHRSYKLHTHGTSMMHDNKNLVYTSVLSKTDNKNIKEVIPEN